MSVNVLEVHQKIMNGERYCSRCKTNHFELVDSAYEIYVYRCQHCGVITSQSYLLEESEVKEDE